MVLKFLIPVLALMTLACATEWTTYDRNQLLAGNWKDNCSGEIPETGYLIDIPAGWTYEAKGCHAVVFDSEDEAIITVATERTPGYNPDPKVAFDQITEGLKKDAYGISQVSFTQGQEVKLHVYHTEVIQQHGHDAVYRIVNNKRGMNLGFVNYCGQTWQQVYILHPDWSANPETQWLYMAESDRCIDDDSHAKDMEKSLRSLRIIKEE